MSKKRKTRKEKERTIIHRLHQTHSEAPTYSISEIKIPEKMEVIESRTDSVVSQKNKSYLKHDIQLIFSASGIIVAFDILLYTLLSRGIIRLPIFGY